VTEASRIWPERASHAMRQGVRPVKVAERPVGTMTRCVEGLDKQGITNLVLRKPDLKYTANLW
jgi:hypothetical protein